MTFAARVLGYQSRATNQKIVSTELHENTLFSENLHQTLVRTKTQIACKICEISLKHLGRLKSALAQTLALFMPKLRLNKPLKIFLQPNNV